MHKRVVRALVLLMVAAVPAVAAAEDSAALLRRVTDRYRSVRSWQASFVQRERLATMGNVRESKGTVTLERPGKMRWEYRLPEPQTMVADGRWLYFHRAGDAVATRLPFDRQALARTPVALLFGDGEPGSWFRAGRLLPEKEGLTRLELIPTAPSPQVSSLALIVRSSDGVVVGSSLRDAFGNRNDLEFTDVRENVTPPADLFGFTPPPGVVVRDAGTGEGRP